MTSAACPVVLVTGSSRGLGRGIAEALAGAGFSVAIHYVRNREAAEETAMACRKLAPRAEQKFAIVGGDVAIAADRQRLFDEVMSAFGHLDALVNNAGVAPRVRADVSEATEEIFDEVLDTNLKGPYFLTQLAAKFWLAHRGQSRIASGYKLIFITSLSAATASINRGEYCISKAGLAMAAQLWAVRLAEEGIQVIELRPGIMATDMTAGVKDKYDKLLGEGLVPLRRWGTPEDVGLAVKAILEGHFPFTTGSAIDLDGGFHLRRL